MSGKLPGTGDIGTLTFPANGQLFFEHPVRYDIEDEVLTYLNKLYSRTIPAPPEILETGCYLWCGALTEDGYAVHRVPKGMTGSSLVHRFVYQQAVGPPPDHEMWEFKNRRDDITLHHSCGNRNCINLLHLCLLPMWLNRDLGDPKALYAV